MINIGFLLRFVHFECTFVHHFVRLHMHFQSHKNDVIKILNTLVSLYALSFDFRIECIFVYDVLMCCCSSSYNFCCLPDIHLLVQRACHMTTHAQNDFGNTCIF